MGNNHKISKIDRFSDLASMLKAKVTIKRNREELDNWYKAHYAHGVKPVDSEKCIGFFCKSCSEWAGVELTSPVCKSKKKVVSEPKAEKIRKRKVSWK